MTIRSLQSLAALPLSYALPLCAATIALGLACQEPARASDGVAAGDVLYRQKCAMCHSIAASGASGIGPNLASVAGRKAGDLPGYSYSPAMRAASLIWDRATLERFMASPRTTLPNTRMSISVSNPAERRAIADYLVNLRKH